MSEPRPMWKHLLIAGGSVVALVGVIVAPFILWPMATGLTLVAGAFCACVWSLAEERRIKEKDRLFKAEGERLAKKRASSCGECGGSVRGYFYGGPNGTVVCSACQGEKES